MSKLTHTLLEFAKASGDAGGLELSKIRIDEVILDLPAQIAKINPAYAVTILFEDLPENEEKLVVYGNQPLLETAIKNILVNACKYSDDHTAVVRLTSTEILSSFLYRTRDPGYRRKRYPIYFNPFTGERKYSRKYGRLWPGSLSCQPDH
jgi:K+-sensing histidine kinase KdpD